MRITFILPSIGISGGTKAVFEFADHLKKLGHNVSIVYPLIPLCSGPKGYDVRGWKNRVKGTIGNLIRRAYVDWFDLKVNLIRVPILVERYIPNADIIVATWWETAYYVNKWNKSKGEKFYLAQHYEVWGGPKEKVNNSYRLGLKIIVNSTWLKNILEKEVKIETEALILHAPDRNDFYFEEKKEERNNIKILIPFRNIKWKGFKDGIKAFEIAQKKHPDINLIVFGPEHGGEIPPYAEFHLKPSNSQLREIYNSCDIFVFPSWFEGFGMPSMEAMACKLPVATTMVGAVPDYTISNETALVSPPRDPEALAQNIIRLIEDKNLRDKIAENGYNYIKQFTWDRATDRLEEVFRKVCLI